MLNKVYVRGTAQEIVGQINYTNYRKILVESVIQILK